MINIEDGIMSRFSNTIATYLVACCMVSTIDAFSDERYRISSCCSTNGGAGAIEKRNGIIVSSEERSEREQWNRTHKWKLYNSSPVRSSRSNRKTLVLFSASSQHSVCKAVFD